MLDNIKQELAKNKEMKESIKKFRDEAKKLEESDALREARRKYVSPLRDSSLNRLIGQPSMLITINLSHFTTSHLLPGARNSHSAVPRLSGSLMMGSKGAGGATQSSRSAVSLWHPLCTDQHTGGFLDLLHQNLHCGGGSRQGDMCILMADSHCSTGETNTTL